MNLFRPRSLRLAFWESFFSLLSADCRRNHRRRMAIRKLQGASIYLSVQSAHVRTSEDEIDLECARDLICARSVELRGELRTEAAR